MQKLFDDIAGPGFAFQIDFPDILSDHADRQQLQAADRPYSFYHLMRWLGADIVFNHADYRLMSQRALQGLSQFKEVNLFLRGLVHFPCFIR